MYNNIIKLNADLNISNLRISDNYKKSYIINNKIPSICENIRKYIYNNRSNLTPETLKIFNIPQFKSLKCPLKQILNNNDDYLKINNIVYTVNDIVTRTLYFIKSYVLHYYENNNNTNDMLDFINFEFISMSVRAITINNPKGNNINDDNLQILKKLLKFYDEHFIKIYPDKINAVGLSQIMNSCKIQIETAFKNNVSMNYFKILKKYMYSHFKKINMENYNKLNKDDKKIFNKQLNKELSVVFKDLIENKNYESDVKYHKWLNDYKNKLVPSVIKNNIIEDIEINPNKYFKYMLNINKLFEINKQKIYNCFPLRTSNVPSNIEIDTLSIINLFLNANITDKYPINVMVKTNIRSLYDKIWSNNFNTDDNIFKYNKHYIFNDSIMTDGFSVTILYVNIDLYGVTIKKNQNLNMLII